MKLPEDAITPSVQGDKLYFNHKQTSTIWTPAHLQLYMCVKIMDVSVNKRILLTSGGG